ncbi:hypothetical protein ID866_4865 [Astraeus odoratus]|nr:hypothetical protein ID866_4865 [Astraeus odoratus]
MTDYKPTHIVLCEPPKRRQVPSLSGFCQKLEVFLRYSDVWYTLRGAEPKDGPKKKIPFAEITHAGRTVTVADSHFIIRYLIENNIVKDPDNIAGLTPEQKAESRAFQAYVEETLYAAVCYERWYIPENCKVTKEEIVIRMHPLLRGIVGWFLGRKIKSLLWTAGIGRHSWEEVQILQKEAVDALEVKLEKHKYFYGDESPSQIDLTIYGFLANILTTKGNPNVTRMIVKSAVLLRFVKEMTGLLFPEYKDLSELVERSLDALDSF